MASKRRNMFLENKKQETTEIGTCNLSSFCDSHQRTRWHHQWEWSCAECGKPFSQRRYMERHQVSACHKYKTSLARTSSLGAVHRYLEASARGGSGDAPRVGSPFWDITATPITGEAARRKVIVSGSSKAKAAQRPEGSQDKITEAAKDALEAPPTQTLPEAPPSEILVEEEEEDLNWSALPLEPCEVVVEEVPDVPGWWNNPVPPRKEAPAILVDQASDRGTATVKSYQHHQCIILDRSHNRPLTVGDPHGVVVSVCDYHAEGPGFDSLTAGARREPEPKRVDPFCVKEEECGATKTTYPATPLWARRVGTTQQGAAPKPADADLSSSRSEEDNAPDVDRPHE
ncbi:hypothetical protein AAG570_007138 [Ranatra chinensis]|uniref:C2H2-type domain-containing protein n=1 Tax=Ranatra chinensis TaxID=642074 RepID=A0ABD0XW82_9HEMI